MGRFGFFYHFLTLWLYFFIHLIFSGLSCYFQCDSKEVSEKGLSKHDLSDNLWENVEKESRLTMSKHFFSGSAAVKLDSKGRFVLPQAMRHGLIEEGELKCTIALGLGGCLAIYRRSDIDEIVERFRQKQHNPRFAKFFTLFFSTLYHTTCDAVGRLTLPASLKSAGGIKSELVVAGVLNKIEIWPKEVYENDLASLMDSDSHADVGLKEMLADAFAMIDGSMPSEQRDMPVHEEALV